MSGAMGYEVADDRVTDEREVADGIENLVAHELVLETQRVVQHAGLAEHDRVLQRAAQRQLVLTQHLDVLQECEGAGRRDFLDEALRRDAKGPRLMAKERVVEADAVGDLEVIRWIQGNPLVAARDRDRPNDFQVPPRHLQRLRARFLNQVHEWRRAAVHDRHFRRIQLDQHVIDVQADERREEVLDGVDRNLIPREPRRPLDPGEVLHGGWDLMVAEVAPAEPNPESRRRRLERELNLVAGVKTNSNTGDGTAEGSLYVH